MFVDRQNDSAYMQLGSSVSTNEAEKQVFQVSARVRTGDVIAESRIGLTDMKGSRMLS